MKKKMIIAFITCFVAGLILPAGPAELQAETVFLTIGSGDFTGVYFPTGLAIAKMINDKRNQYGIRATVEATPGSVFNLKAIISGYLEFGLVQADKQYQAVNGLAEWTKSGPQKELRAVFSLHHESVVLVAAVDAGIKTISDLKGKRVNLGNPGSGQHRNAIDALKAVGLDPKRDIFPQEVKATEAPALLIDDRIDAFFCTVGHPSETIQMALSGQRKVRVIPISGPAIDKLIADNKFYSKTTIPVQRLYPGLENSMDVSTFGVIATLCTSSKLAEDLVYTVTKEAFENLNGFRRQHPALVNLTKEGMLEGLSAPLHPGALKYYKEAGLMK
ncbi:MAG: TAXI family TRAP transporter solute-binding subunit [Desulfobacteraceae bacterium]|jgi:TRAP transporter TAXI family solute receptor|nr:TAXI family TRAP transporter solute-binding subunit [Desulfobacteraceae bacterium]